MSNSLNPASLLEASPDSKRRIAILGSTGSIGMSTLKIVEAYPQRFSVTSLAAGSNVDVALDQCCRWRPKLVSMATEERAAELQSRLEASGVRIPVCSGATGAVQVATHADANFVVSAIVGVAGLEATFEAVRAGKWVGLANKECLVAAGELITAEARRQGKPLLPIDSEHNAVHQCMRGGTLDEVTAVWLTASGGPFLNTPKSEFSRITVQQALNHPTWKMGKRITIDSATLMNKGFEVIEACRLFNLPPDRVKVIVHPQSTIHSLVEFRDGSILAQLSVTDMRLPILYALTYPERLESELKFDLTSLKKLDFSQPDTEKFPCLNLAYEAAQAGGAKAIALNAADEVAVAAFLDGVIGFEGIPKTIKRVLDETTPAHPESIKKVLQIDAEARAFAAEVTGLERPSVPALGVYTH
ncbi:MAG TPA: 1-deoxy-D-xylulose-5-phosphate reductoisomerase [Terriglobales bacterium]|nr:1-deoxy-D-xylulose-5-phosphate reductoisomerase [Terriglobales bacterium]